MPTKAIANTRVARLSAEEFVEAHAGTRTFQRLDDAGILALVLQANPDLTSRELAQQVRELRTKAGARNKQSAGVTRPTGPNRHGAKQAAAAAKRKAAAADKTAL